MFIENKYTKWYFTIIENAKDSDRKRLKRTHPNYMYYEAHHIIPVSMGGTEIVLLTAKEHFICHLLLPKMTTDVNKHKMINALIKMTYSKSDGQERYNAKSFAVVRSFIAEKNRETLKGKPKSEKTKQNMKGRSGTWKRTDEHNRATSERQKGKKMGDLNPARRPEERLKQKDRMKQWWKERKANAALSQE